MSAEDPQAPQISVLIVGYNNRRHIDACIGGALRGLAGIPHEVLFVDCSDDGSESHVRNTYPSVRVLRYSGNLGFGRGNNELAKIATGSYLLLLNPDTRPNGSELVRLLEFARSHPGAGAWGGTTVLPDGEPDPGSHQPMLTVGSRIASIFGIGSPFSRRLLPRSTAPQRVDVISGAFFLLQRETWIRIGGFDPLFFLYAEEVDLCRRIADLGLELWVDPSIVLVHDGGSGDGFSRQRQINTLRGNATYFIKHCGPVMSAIARAAMLLTEIRRLLVAASIDLALRPRSASARFTRSAAAVRGLSEWWNGWPQPRPSTSLSTRSAGH